jgi:hypothetical protein
MTVNEEKLTKKKSFIALALGQYVELIPLIGKYGRPQQTSFIDILLKIG